MHWVEGFLHSETGAVLTSVMRVRGGDYRLRLAPGFDVTMIGDTDTAELTAILFALYGIDRPLQKLVNQIHKAPSQP